jgi:hypothetical protein
MSIMSDRNEIDMLRELILKELVGGLWHTTHPDRFTKILETGGISPEPDIPERDRWGTRNGRESYSYARFIGGVSLFDLHEFGPESYTNTFPASSWHYFIPFQTEHQCDEHKLMPVVSPREWYKPFHPSTPVAPAEISEASKS